MCQAERDDSGLPPMSAGPQPPLVEKFWSWACKDAHKFSKLPHPDHVGQFYCSACFLWLTPVPYEGYRRERRATAPYAHINECDDCLIAERLGDPSWRCNEERAREL